MGESLLESYSIILVLPETVLKRTKRAMKHISDLIKWTTLQIIYIFTFLSFSILSFIYYYDINKSSNLKCFLATSDNQNWI